MDGLSGHALRWPTTFWCVALMQALNAVGLVYRLCDAAAVSPRSIAALLTLLLGGASTSSARRWLSRSTPTSCNFRSGPRLLFHALRAFETRSAAHWAALTLAFALAFYAKYTVALFVVVLGAASLAVPSYRGVWREARLYLAAAAGLILIAPHLLAARASGAVGHADGDVVAERELGWRLNNLGEFALGFVAYLAPAWVWLAASYRRGEWERDAGAGSRRSRRPRDDRDGAGIAALLILGFGFKYPSRYNLPFLFLVWLAGASFVRFEPERFPAARALDDAGRRRLRRRRAGGRLAALRRVDIHPRQQEPLSRRQGDCRRNGTGATPAGRPMSWAISGAPMASACR